MSPQLSGAGILTFLIADVRGYTAFTQSRGDEAAARLAAKFAEIAREGVEAHDGEVIELRGDEALAVFVSAREALRAAVDLQLVFADEIELDPSLPLRVGVGLDAGEAVPVDGGYRGGALNLAARLCSQARAGEVLASQGVTHLSRALDGIELHEYGEVELKGLSEPVRVFRVSPADLDPDVLALRFEPNGAASAVVHRTELPVALDPVTPIVGRELDLRRLRWAWRVARRGHGSTLLVVGPTGIGKTRLAAEGALTAADNGASVAYVSFAGTDDPATAAAAALDGGWPAYAVFDDLESADPSLLPEILDRVAGLDQSHGLVLLVFDDERASAELVAALRRVAGDEQTLRPRPLDLDDIRRIAGLYLGDAVDALPPGLLESSGGVPRRIHEQVADWAHSEASRRLGGFASQAAAGRNDLRSVEADLASSVVDLQLVRERARMYGAGPGRGAPEPVEAPYKGLASFETGDADWFFGRERLVADQIARLAGAAFLGVVGPSGSGKSSAVRAGLVPALAAAVLPGSADWTTLVMRPGEHPLRELDRTLWGKLPKPLLDRIEGQDLPLRAVREALGEGERILLVVDQFEEVFTACTDEREQRAFVAALIEAARDPRGGVVVVLALRADFYGRCAADPELAGLLGANHVLVGPMTADEYRRAIEQPALRAGVRFEPALVDELVGEVLGEAGALPLLSTALLELWERREGRLIRIDAYRQTGGVRGAVARLAEDVYAGLDDAQQAIARSVLLRLAGPGEGSAVVRRRVPLAEFDAERNERVAEVLGVLTARRLVTVSEGSVEVAHEALLREWPRFQDWLEEDREGRRLHGHLMETAREWAGRGRDPADLYRGARLASALDWTTEHTLELNEVEREFVNASRAENERDLTRQRKHNRRLRGALIGVGILLLLAIAAGAIALVARSNAQHSATVALARQLGAEAVSEPRVDRAMLLAREAVDLNESTQTEGTLLATLLRSPTAVGVSTMPITLRPLQLAVSPDGRTLAVAVNSPETWFFDTRTHKQAHAPLTNSSFGVTPVYSRHGRVLLLASGVKGVPVLDVLDARTLRHRMTLRYDPVFLSEPVNAQLFAASPDGKTAYFFYAIANQDGSDGPAYVDRWDVATGKRTVFPLGSRGLPGAGLTSDGKKVITVTDSEITAWDARTMKRLSSVAQPVAANPTPIGAVSPDGRTVALGTSLGTVIFVDTRTGRTRSGAGAHTSDVQNLAWLPNSRDLVSTGDDARVIVWDATTAQPIETLLGHGGRVAGAAVSADGRTLYTASLDGSIFQWDLGAGRRFGRPLAVPQTASPPELAAGGAGQPTPPLAASPDGSRFAALAGPSTVALYSTSTARRLRQFAVDTGGNVISMAWSRKGPLVITGENGNVQLWDVEGKPRLIRRLVGLRSQNKQPEAVIAAGVSSDGRLVVAGDVNHTPGNTPYRFGSVAVWDAGSGRLLWKTTSKRGTVTAVAFSPDGTLVAAGYENGEVVLYEAATGQPRRTLLPEGGGGPSFETLAFAPDGTLATGTWAGIVQLWNPATGKQIGHPTLVTPSPVASLSFDPKGDVFSTTGGSDGTAKLWTTKTQQQFGATFPGDPGHWGNAVYTPSGSKLIVFYEDGTGFVWPTSVDAWKSHACAVAGRNFTPEEWRRFVSGHSYAKTCPGLPKAS